MNFVLSHIILLEKYLENIFLNCGIEVSYILQWHLGVNVLLLTGERNKFYAENIFSTTSILAFFYASGYRTVHPRSIVRLSCSQDICLELYI
jgi:hypothetical protein